MNAPFYFEYVQNPDSELLLSQLDDQIGPDWDERDLTLEQREILGLPDVAVGRLHESEKKILFPILAKEPKWVP